MRRLNPEISLGFLVASLFWIGVLGWQSSYSPTEKQKDECYEDAKKTGYKNEDCKTFWERTTGDPIALFNLILAFSTVGLWVANIFLYRAGEKQIAIAKIAAGAAKDAADAARTSADHIPTVERAYIFATPQPAIESDRTIVTLMLENFGQTPAIVTEVYGRNSETEPIGQPLYVPSERNPRFLEAVLGKGSKEPFPTRWWSPITVPHFFFGYVRYMDIFRTQHTTRFCVRIFPKEGRVDLAGPSIWNSWN